MNAPLQTAVRDYIGAGFVPVPLLPHSKNPGRDGWQNLRVTVDEVPTVFSGEANVGLLLGMNGNGLTDLDCDCPEAARLARWFALPTTFKSGRPSNPHSHYWYRCDVPPAPGKFSFEGACLLELRSTGQQSMVWPSTHPCGEQIEWYETEGEPAKVDSAELVHAVEKLAAATLLVRHYPPTGTRHEFALSLSGFLLRRGWVADHVKHFVEAVCQEAGDDEVHDRLAAVETTITKHAAGEETLGGVRLRRIVGNSVFDTFSTWLGFNQPVASGTIEADVIPNADAVPSWPAATLDGDFLSELTWLLTSGTNLHPQFVREMCILVLAALANGKLGYPRHPDLPLRRYLAVISEHPQSGKGESWRRLTAHNGEGGSLRPLLVGDELKILHGTGVGSGQFLARELQENPRAIVCWDELDHLLKVARRDGSTLFSALKTLFESTSLWTGSLTNKKHGGDDFHLSVLMQSTRATFQQGFALANASGDGLLSRYVLAYADRMPAIPEWAPRDFHAEREVVGKLQAMMPVAPMVPTITDDARAAMNGFAIALNDPQSPEFALGRRLFEHTKVDLLMRCCFSGAREITLEMTERSILWGRHQLALRRALWQPDARSEIAAMSQTLVNRLRKGTASQNDLRRSANVDRDGIHELFTRSLNALTRSGQVIKLGTNKKGKAIFGLEPEEE